MGRVKTTEGLKIVTKKYHSLIGLEDNQPEVNALLILAPGILTFLFGLGLLIYTIMS